MEYTVTNDYLNNFKYTTSSSNDYSLANKTDSETPIKEENISEAFDKAPIYRMSNNELVKCIKHYFIQLYNSDISNEQFRVKMLPLFKAYIQNNDPNTIFTKKFFDNIKIPEIHDEALNKAINSFIPSIQNGFDEQMKNKRAKTLTYIAMNELLHQDKIIDDSILEKLWLQNLRAKYGWEENENYTIDELMTKEKLHEYLMLLAARFINNEIDEETFREEFKKAIDANISDIKPILPTFKDYAQFQSISYKLFYADLIITAYVTKNSQVELDKMLSFLNHLLSEDKAFSKFLKDAFNYKMYIGEMDKFHYLLIDSEIDIEYKISLIINQYRYYISNLISVSEFMARIELILCNKVSKADYIHMLLQYNSQFEDNYHFICSIEKFKYVIRNLMNKLYDGEFSHFDFLELVHSYIYGKFDVDKLIKAMNQENNNFNESIAQLIKHQNIEKAKNDNEAAKILNITEDKFFDKKKKEAFQDIERYKAILNKIGERNKSSVIVGDVFEDNDEVTGEKLFNLFNKQAEENKKKFELIKKYLKDY